MDYKYNVQIFLNLTLEKQNTNSIVSKNLYVRSVMKLELNKKIIVISSISFVTGALFFFGVSKFYIYQKSDNYNFINPSLKYSELREVLMANKTLDMSGAITSYIDEQKRQGKISQVSVYFRNLNNGGRFGINEKLYFSPASLMKLPILLAYVKRSETNKGLLDEKVVYKEDTEAVGSYKQNIPSENKLENGHLYSRWEILENLIIYSDNGSAAFLSENIPLDEVKAVFSGMGIPFPQYLGASFDNNIDVIDYATFFRKLYNSSYLNMENSEKVLNLLSKVKFTNGLVAGVKSISGDVIISHKFGERGIIGQDGREEKQLHDCGIVYYPKYPYIACIMTRGYDLTVLENTLSDISKLMYQEVDDVYKDE